jgi:hypothetical protein
VPVVAPAPVPPAPPDPPTTPASSRGPLSEDPQANESAAKARTRCRRMLISFNIATDIRAIDRTSLENCPP